MLGFFRKIVVLLLKINDVTINFDPVSVPQKREREQRLRICKITFSKGKRKNAKTNNLKQEEKIIL